MFSIIASKLFNGKNKEVTAAKINYSNHTYVLLEIYLNLSASILKKNVWISGSQSSVDYILYVNKNMFIIKGAFIIKYMLTQCIMQLKKVSINLMKNIFYDLTCYTNYINSSRNACRLGRLKKKLSVKLDGNCCEVSFTFLWSCSSWPP